MKKQEDIELINDYFHERLSPDVKKKFEDRWRNDDDFAQEIAFYLNLTKSVKTKHDADVQSFVKGAKEDYFRQRRRRRLLVGFLVLFSFIVGWFAWNWFKAGDTEPQPTELNDETLPEKNIKSNAEFAMTTLPVEISKISFNQASGSNDKGDTNFDNAVESLQDSRTFKDALKYIERSIEKDEQQMKTIDGQLTCMEIYLMNSNFDDCLNKGKDIKAEIPDKYKLRYHFIMGRAYIGIDDFGNAKEQFKMCKDLNPISPNITRGIKAAYVWIGMEYE